MVKVISLDFAGVVVSKRFIDYFWLEAIPKALSEKKGWPIDRAKEFVLREYDSISMDGIEWYLPSYWLERFDIPELLDALLEESTKYIEVYSDVYDVLPALASKFKVIISTNTTMEFINIFMEKHPWFKQYIHKVYSCTSHYSLPRKTREFYTRIVEDLKVSPKDILHVGDDVEYDYRIPKSIGINAILVVRGEVQGQFENSISSLKEILGLLGKL